MYRITPTTRSFDLLVEYELSKEEDAPMSVAVDGLVSRVLSPLRCIPVLSPNK